MFMNICERFTYLYILRTFPVFVDYGYVTNVANSNFSTAIMFPFGLIVLGKGVKNIITFIYGLNSITSALIQE